MKCYRYFFGFLEKQENWLNKKAMEGYKLIGTGKMLYEFEPCAPGEMQYRVEFNGHKSRSSAEEYRSFLQELGYQVFYKNINLNYSIGKVKYRPWAEKGGRIATNASTFNRELLIVGKVNDGKDFQLHSTNEDKAIYYKALRGPWLCFFLLFAIFAVYSRSLLFGLIALVSLIPVLFYQTAILQLRRSSRQ